MLLYEEERRKKGKGWYWIVKRQETKQPGVGYPTWPIEALMAQY
jgi:hypothetical protein